MKPDPGNVYSASLMLAAVHALTYRNTLPESHASSEDKQITCEYIGV